MGTDLDPGSLSPARRDDLEQERLDLLDPELHLDPYATYAWLRANRPVSWDPTNELWGVSRYDDIVDIERRKDTFINSDQAKGGYRPNLPADPAMIGLDDPAHSERRHLVARRFTPRAAANWEDEARRVVNALLDGVEQGGGTAEIIDQLAAPLPAMMIGKLLGFDPERWPDLKRWSETTIALGGGPRYNSHAGRDRSIEFATAAAALAEEKRRCPADDVMSLWTSSDRRRLPDGRGDDLLRQPAPARRRRGDDAHRDRPHAAEPDRPPRPVGAAAERRRHHGRRRGVHPLRHPDPQHVPGRGDGRRGRRRQIPPGNSSC